MKGFSLKNWFSQKKDAKVQRHRARMEVPPVQLNWIETVQRSLKIFAWVAIVVLGIVVVNRPITRVTVVGSFQRVSAVDVEQLVRIKLKGGFLTANLWELQHELEVVPWVAAARLERHWPHTLVVVVNEQQSIATWDDSGLLNSRGDVFVRDIKYAPADLPRLQGPEGSEHEVTDLFLKIQPKLGELGFAVSELALDERGAWRLKLSNGVDVRFGNRALSERLDRFIKVGAPVLTGRSSDIAFIDMRYSNGFSVGWRTQNQVKSESQAASDSTPSKRDQHG